MTNVEYIYQVIQRYFSDSAVVVLAILALLFLLKRTEKIYKWYAICLGIIMLLLFNDFTYGIVKKIGESETYYRFLWMIPITLLAAYLVIEIWGGLSGKLQKAGYVVVLCVFLFLNNTTSFGAWINLPENVYQISDEQIQAAKIIRANQRKWRAKFWDDGTISNGLREYDGTIMLTLDTTEYMDDIINNKEINVSGSTIQLMLLEYQIDSIAVKKDYIKAQKVFEGAGCKKIGETQSSYLYRFEWRNVESRRSTLENYYNDTITEINEEHIQVNELETAYELLFLTDMYLDVNNIESAEEQLSAWIQMANEYDVDAVLLGANMLTVYSEDEVFYVKEQLEQLEMSYLWVEDGSDTFLDLGDVTICAINNRDSSVDEMMIKNRLNSMDADDKKMLLTFSPIETEMEEGLVEGVFSGNGSTYNKCLISDTTLQYVGIPANGGRATLITIYGE